MNSGKYILSILLAIWIVLIIDGAMKISSNKSLIIYIIILSLLVAVVALCAYFLTAGGLL